MLRMSKEEAVKENVARQSLLRNLNVPESYNTGATVVASSAPEYVGYLLYSQSQYLYSHPQQQRGGIFGTGAGAVVIFEVRGLTAVAAPALITPAAIVDLVRSTFLLTVSQAAKVFQVSRPTIYQWESLTDIQMIRSQRDRERMRTLYLFAELWQSLGPLKGRWLTATLISGHSVIELLCEDTLDEHMLRSAHRQLTAATAELQEAEHLRSMDAVGGLADSFAALAEAEARRTER